MNRNRQQQWKTAVMITTLTCTAAVWADDKVNPPTSPQRDINAPAPAQSDVRPDLSQPRATGYTVTQPHMKASKLIGKNVRGANNESIGEVKDIIINLGSGRAPFAIIGFGGALGIGETRVAVPLNELQWTADGDLVNMNVTRDQLKAASETPSGGWVAYSNEPWAKDIDRYYGTPLTYESRFERQPFESAREAREREFVREPSTLGTTDQNLQQQLNNMLKQDAIGTSRNVHATVHQGVVTLSGQVDSQAEKDNLEQKAKGLAGVQRVENQLTVKDRD